MSDIKSITGTGGTGGIDPDTSQETPANTEGSRFRDLAKRLRHRESNEETTEAQPGGSAQNLPDASMETALLKARIQGQQGNSYQPSTEPASASAAPSTGPSLRDLFNSPTPSLTQPKPTSAPIFTPTFMDANNINILTGTVSPLNQTYFATPETAQWLVQQKLPALGFPGATIIEKQAQASGGPFVANQKELWIQLPDGAQLNAGQLADYYVNNPEDQFPNVADTFVKQSIQGEMKAHGG